MFVVNRKRRGKCRKAAAVLTHRATEAAFSPLKNSDKEGEQTVGRGMELQNKIKFKVWREKFYEHKLKITRKNDEGRERERDNRLVVITIKPARKQLICCL